MIMKRLILSIIALSLSVTLLAQGTVTTRKYRFSDFPDKMTKVVLSGDEILCSALKQEVVSHWTASAFEFCSLEEFERIKTEDRYYFLILTDQQFKGEESPSLQMLSLVKGGAAAAEGLGEMDEIISLAVAPVQGGNGRELVFLGGFVQAVQDFILAALESEKTAYRKTDWFNDNYSRYGKMKQVYIPRDDIAPGVTPAQLETMLDEDIHLTDADGADEAYLAAPYNTLVSYVVAPQDAGSWCYKYLFEAETQQLYFVSRHKLSAKKGAGFLAEDLKKIARKR
jgi:hypothetical protein